MQGAPPKNKGKPKAFGHLATPSPTSSATNGFVMVPLSGKFTTPLPSFAPIGLYDPAKDNTLTSTQAKQGSFKKDSKAGATHEKRRNVAKRIVEDGFDSLEPPVRKHVRKQPVAG
jgi:hypothetical protein